MPFAPNRTDADVAVMPSPPARRAAAPGPPAPARHRAAPRPARVSVYGTGTSGSGGRPRYRRSTATAYAHALAASCRAKSTCPASSCSGSVKLTSVPAGADDEHRGAGRERHERHLMPGADPQAQMRRRAAPGRHAASFCSAAGRPIPREGARTPVAFSEYASRAAHLFLPSPEQRDEST